MVDALCFDDLDLFGRELDDPIEELRQDQYHRLIEPPGSNIDDVGRGLGVDEMLSGVFDPTVCRKIENELRKDNRVAAVVAEFTEADRATGTFAIDIRSELDGQALGLTLVADGQGGVKPA